MSPKRAVPPVPPRILTPRKPEPGEIYPAKALPASLRDGRAWLAAFGGALRAEEALVFACRYPTIGEDLGSIAVISFLLDKPDWWLWRKLRQGWSRMKQAHRKALGTRRRVRYKRKMDDQRHPKRVQAAFDRAATKLPVVDWSKSAPDDPHFDPDAA